MKSKLLNKNAYEAICRNCRHGRLSPEGDTVLCVKKGIVDPDGSCRRYSYDPLKRVPRKMPAVREANPEDFDLNAGIDIPKKVIGIPLESVEEETVETVETVPAEAEKEEILVAEETPEPVAEEDTSEEAVIPEEHPDNRVVLDEGEEDEEILFDDDDETLFGDDEDYLDEDDDLGEDFFDDDEDDEYDEYDDGESFFDDDDDIIFDNDDDDGFDEDEELFLDEIFEEEEDDPSKDWSKTSIFDVGDETENK
jgi:hypothetical protein